MDNDPKYTGKAIQEFVKAKKLDSLQWPSQLSLNIACFSVNEVKIKKLKFKAERSINKKQLKETGIKAWRSISREEKTVFDDESETSDSHLLQRIFIKFPFFINFLINFEHLKIIGYV